MTVTKQVYTATATTTASAIAAQLRLAFIDAGLMTEWFDSFLSGTVENRVLEVTYDAGATYGKTYYWFMISAAGVVAYNVCTGWNAGTDVPTGTQYLDFFATTTNAVTNHRALITVSFTANVVITRYTSGTDTNVSWFVFSQGTLRSCFGIVKGGAALQSWCNLNRGFISLLYEPSCTTFANAGAVAFRRYCSLRRELGRGIALNGSTSIADYVSSSPRTQGSEYGYMGLGNASNSFSNNAAQLGLQEKAGIILPIGFTATNGAYTTNSSPVFHSLSYSQWLTGHMSSDFGVNMLYTANTVDLFDKLIVAAGVEEWEILDYANSATLNTSPTPLFLARVV
jgi:hypothetical protein